MHYNWANLMKDAGNKTEAEFHYNEAIRYVNTWHSHKTLFLSLYVGHIDIILST